MKKRLGSLASIVLVMVVVRLLFGSWWSAIWLITSVFLHELGHMAALKKFGVNSTLTFDPLGGGIIPERGERFEALQHFEHAVVSLAGVAVNMGLLSVGLLFYATSSDSVWSQLAWANAILAAWNALPLGIFDGSELVRSIFASLAEKEVWRIAGGIVMVAVLLMAGMLLCDTENALGYFFFPPLICWGIMREASRRGDPMKASFLRAMSKPQAVWFTALYTIVLFGSYIAMVFSLSWLP